MEPALRRAFNQAFSDDLFARYRRRLESQVGPVPFQVAETPLFLPRQLAEEAGAATTELIAMLAAPALARELRSAVPAHLDVPGCEGLPACATFDFAVARRADGGLCARIVELQAFPSIYAFTALQAAAWWDTLMEIPGFPRTPLLPYYGADLRGPDALSAATALLRRTIVGDADPDTVALVDLDPAHQKTRCDFLATEQLLGIDTVCPSDITRDGRRLYRQKNGRRVPLTRIFNRIVFDELERRSFPVPWSWTEALDVTWVPHPNWYWLWSKFVLPRLDHPAVPKATLVSDLGEPPADLERYVLKPLFSYAGSGVIIDVTRADLERVPAAERAGWVLQEKIEYARDLFMPDGGGVAAEVRILCLLDPADGRLRPAWNLVRLSRGKMCGVDHNRDMTWVGSSVGIWA